MYAMEKEEKGVLRPFYLNFLSIKETLEYT